MKIFQTIAERTADILLIFVLGLTAAVSGSFLLQNGPGVVATATVVEGGDRAVYAGDSLDVTSSAADQTTSRTAETATTKRAVSTAPAEKAVSFGNGRILDSGEASFYGREFEGRSTASGEPFDPAALTAAHRTLPFGSKVRVTNAHNGRSVVVRINDRGPFVEDRLIDISSGAAKHLGMVQSGTARVVLELQ